MSLSAVVQLLSLPSLLQAFLEAAGSLLLLEPLRLQVFLRPVAFLLLPLPWHSPVPAAAFLSWPWPHHLLVTCPHALLTHCPPGPPLLPYPGTHRPKTLRLPRVVLLHKLLASIDGNAGPHFLASALPAAKSTHALFLSPSAAAFQLLRFLLRVLHTAFAMPLTSPHFVSYLLWLPARPVDVPGFLASLHPPPPPGPSVSQQTPSELLAVAAGDC
mmetsp:Transcript_55986/g.122439  ORF Transcript_55986/g.122439 Transcript_55986/m.122439 type:complete len:215 (-) Transcript_55986:606-1250(-)